MSQENSIKKSVVITSCNEVYTYVEGRVQMHLDMHQHKLCSCYPDVVEQVSPYEEWLDFDGHQLDHEFFTGDEYVSDEEVSSDGDIKENSLSELREFFYERYGDEQKETSLIGSSLATALSSLCVTDELYNGRNEENATWHHGGVIGSQITCSPEILAGGMPPKKRLKGKKRKQGNIQPKNRMYGTVQRPPTPTIGNNVKPMKPPKNSVFGREFKLQIAVSTTGAQVFDNIAISLYKPMQYTRVVAGTITATQGMSTALTDALVIFREYRVKKILLQYTNSLGTGTAFPPIIVAMDPESTPTNVGSTTGVNYLNAYQNSIQLDAHISSAVGYWVPPPTSLASSVDNIMAGGWLSTDYAGTGFVASDVGVIGMSYGNATVLGAPLTTTSGILDVIYHIEFKIPES